MHEAIQKMFDLSGQVAMIAGGARDLGLDMATVLGQAGADLVITSRSQDSASQAAARLSETLPVDILPLGLDITKPDEVTKAAEQAYQWKGHIDILMNNAGGTPQDGPRRLFAREPEQVHNLININLIGTIYVCRAVGRFMQEQGHGNIINIASIAGLCGRDRRMYDRSNMDGQPVDYAAAKAGIIGLTRDLAALLGPMQIRVNCISPGGFDRNLPPTFSKDYGDATPLGRMGKDGVDIKGAILFLASPASGYVHGHNLVVDGGFTVFK
jgi:NAD(P)-dependent dehydrogenase (short-subunit alcohol dehydrogenase family)